MAAKTAMRACGVLLLVVLQLTGCVHDDVVAHAFSFDTLADSPGIEILDYRYGESRLPSAQNPENLRLAGKSRQSVNINGEMKRPSFLYVKWRIRQSGEVFEDTVDLARRLPADIAERRVHFIVRGPQLYVYLIGPNRTQGAPSSSGPRVYSYLKTVTIYPDQQK
jgi:hypothetical protein